MAEVQRTVVVFKPDAVARGLSGRLLQRIEDAGLKIVGLKLVMTDADLVRAPLRRAERSATVQPST